MSDQVFDGLAKVTALPQRGMITLRSDLGSGAMNGAVTVPGRGRVVGTPGTAWMSPDELLVMCDHAAVSAEVMRLTEALKGTHHLVQDVSDARALFAIHGAAARDVIAKLCPVDMRPGMFDQGRFRRSRLAQVPCAVWMTGDDSFELMVFASVRDYAWGVLKAAADPAAAVDHFA